MIENGDNAIGYFDNNKWLHLYGEDGYFDEDGNYYIENILQGYFDKDGLLNKGKNSSFEGFYDMFGYWHLFGDKGYYIEGYYYPDVTDSKVGYFNEVGEFTEGFNPYVNGYNDINGNWSDSFSLPLTLYYEHDGTARIGTNPYEDGYYDMYANWHRYNDRGYFDKHGTYYSISSASIGYYDNRGNYMEGTNPYLHGYYDEDGNLRIFDKVGYYTREGTYVDDKGEWYFLANGMKKRGENTNLEGFYDDEGNYYPFNEYGYYTFEGIFFPTLLIVDRYTVGSPNYILFEGVFENPDYVPTSSKTTIQFTFNPQDAAPIYVDTGIRVSRNAMISYSNARDLLHNIAIYSSSVFIEDNSSCMLVIDGRIVNLTDSGKMSIKELRDKFKDFNISIEAAKTRVGMKFALADAIEIGKDIRILYNNVKRKISNPMVVYNGSPYIALKDVLDITIYNAKVENSEGVKNITFTMKDSADSWKKEAYPDGLSMEFGNTSCLVNISGNTFAYRTLKAPIITQILSTGSEEVYIPIYLLSELTGTCVEYNTRDYLLELKTIIEAPYEDD